MKISCLPRCHPGSISCFICFLAAGLSAKAALVSESFDGYGAATVSLAGLNSGTGWRGAWYNVIGTDMNYVPSNTNFANAASGYVDINGLTTNDGQMQGTVAGDYNNNRTGRLIAGDPITSGTVWVSFVTTFDANGRVQLYLNGSATSPRMGLDVRRLFVRGSATTLYSTGPTVTTDRTWLVVCRIDLNTDGTNDTLTVYAIASDNPSALTAASIGDGAVNLLREVTQTGAFLDQITSVNLVLDDGTFLDQLRISHGLDVAAGFQQVLTGSTGGPVPVAPPGVDVAFSGPDIVVSFDSDSAFNYTLEVSTDNMGTWGAVPDQLPAAPVAGNDAILSITDPGGAPASGARVFYRVNVSN
jgi:hypothetical protein